MANFATALKAEILRLARKEVRQQTAALQRASAAHRRQIAALRRQVVALERKAGELGRRSARPAPVEDEAGSAAAPRFVAKGLKSLRARLGASAGDLGRLLGVSGQSVYNWENGKATPRRAQLLALAELRGLGKREVQARLAGDAAVAAPRKAKAAGPAKSARKSPRRGAGKPARKQAAAKARKLRRRAG
jgi:DNA-binding transcriptional regulator YiaG